MQKRWIACLLAILMVFGLFACGQPAENNPVDGQADTPEPAQAGGLESLLINKPGTDNKVRFPFLNRSDQILQIAIQINHGVPSP